MYTDELYNPIEEELGEPAGLVVVPELLHFRLTLKLRTGILVEKWLGDLRHVNN